LSNRKKVIHELRMLAGDYLLAGALKLYPEGKERDSLASFLASHFKLMVSYNKDERAWENER
jgi:hypothetical protein